MDIGFDKLREHLRPTYRAHRTITIGGIQPNIIADKGQIWWFVRDANMPDAKETYDKLLKIAEGAALMTGTTYDVKYAASAWPQLVQQGDRRERSRRTSTRSACRNGREEEQQFARDFQKCAGEADRSACARRRRRSADARSRRRRTTTATCPGWCRPACVNFPGLGSRHRLSRMEGGGDAGELDLAQGSGGGREGAGGLDHRPDDDAGAAAEGARRIRGRVRRRRRISRWCRPTSSRPRAQPRRDGEIPRRDAEVLSDKTPRFN